MLAKQSPTYNGRLADGLDRADGPTGHAHCHGDRQGSPTAAVARQRSWHSGDGPARSATYLSAIGSRQHTLAAPTTHGGRPPIAHPAAAHKGTHGPRHGDRRGSLTAAVQRQLARRRRSVQRGLRQGAQQSTMIGSWSEQRRADAKTARTTVKGAIGSAARRNMLLTASSPARHRGAAGIQRVHAPTAAAAGPRPPHVGLAAAC